MDDLAAVRGRLERIRDCYGQAEWVELRGEDFRALLADHSAQAARLAAALLVLAEVAEDDDPRDGCTYAEAAKRVLGIAGAAGEGRADG